MESNDDEYTMAEQLASWAQKVIGPLVVASILGIFASGLYTRDAVYSIDSRVSALEKWSEKTEDNRYKSSDGVLERITRETADKAIRDELEELIAENIRIWTSIRLHIEKGEHQGAHYRLLSLEEYMRNDKKNNHKHQ